MSNEIKKEDGPNRTFSTGAERQASSGKGTPVLVPGDAIIDIAKHFEKGANIYGARNWEKGIPLSELLNSLERHLQQEKMGLTDEPHARALAWNALVYLATKLRIENGLLPAELNDMPSYRLEHKIVLGPTAKETMDEILSINEDLSEEFKDEPVERITDPDHPDYLWYCESLGCYEQGKANSGDKTFLCAEHKKGT